MKPLSLRVLVLPTALLTLLLTGIVPVAGRAGAVSGTLYFTRFSGSPRVEKVDFSYDGGTNFFLTNLVGIADLSGADGLVIAPDGNLIIGGQGNVVFKVDPVSGATVSASAGGGAAFHMSLDPNRQRAWSDWGGSPLIEVPLNPFGNATTHPLTGNDTSVLTLAWDPAGNVYYTSASGGFGVIDLTSFVTTRRLNPPADHGMAYDPFTGTLVISGGNHLIQVSANPTNPTVISDLDLGTRGISVQFDQGTVDGRGHAFFADNNGKLVFVDYSASKLVGATNNFVAAPFLAPNLDDVAPISLAGNTNTADLAVSILPAANPAPPLVDLPLTITLTNKGPDTATGVELETTPLPDNVAFVSVNATTGSAGVTNGGIAFAADQLAAHTAATITAVVRPLSGPFDLRAHALANETDPYFFDNFTTLQEEVPYSCFQPPAGLVSWWPADGNANDVVGTNNGALLGNAAFSPGLVGGAFAFDGNNGPVQILDSPSLRLTNLTVECWMNFSAVGGIRSVVGKPYGGGTLDSFAIWQQDTTLHAGITGPNGFGPILGYNWNPMIGTWYHVAFTYDHDLNAEALYLNGVLVASNTVNDVIVYDNHPVLIGGDIENGSLNYIFWGKIDEVSLYDRALSPAEIKAIVNAYSAGKCATPVLVPGALTDGTTNVPYAQALSLAHATPPYTFKLAAGSGPLPPGLTLNAAGLLGGTPTATGSFPVMIQGTDASNEVAQANYTVNILPCRAPPLGLIGWWRAEGDATDAIGSHNGTLRNNVQFVPGRVGQAFSLDGSSAYVDLGAWSPGAQWTLEAWANPAYLPGGRHTIVGSAAECRDWAIVIQDGQFGLAVRPPGGCSTTILSGVRAIVGTWYYLVGTCDGTNAQIYVNGVLMNSGKVDPNYIGTAAGTRIGSEVCCGAYFPGLIDEVSIYDRPLGTNEIQAIYAAGAAGKCPGGQPPQITTQPQSQILLTGTNAVFTVAASGPGPYSYQWFLNQIPIPGQANPSLTLSNLTGAEAGLYSVAVGNPAGTVFSSPPASLTVINLNLYAGILIDGIVGRTYRIDYVNDLSSTNWITLTNLALQTSPYLFIDSQSATTAHRFYRAVLLP